MCFSSVWGLTGWKRYKSVRQCSNLGQWCGERNEKVGSGFKSWVFCLVLPRFRKHLNLTKVQIPHLRTRETDWRGCSGRELAYHKRVLFQPPKSASHLLTAGTTISQLLSNENEVKVLETELSFISRAPRRLYLLPTSREIHWLIKRCIEGWFLHPSGRV